MVDRREHAGLALEAGDPAGIAGELVGKNLDGDLAAELEVPGAIDLAHAAGAERVEDLVGAEAGPGLQGH